MKNIRRAKQHFRIRTCRLNKGWGWLFVVLIVSFFCLVSYGDDSGVLESVTTGEHSEDVGQKCPVMTENDIKPEIFTDYEGRRVYFCCKFCKAAFAKDPEKYLPRLGKVGSVEDEGHHQLGSDIDNHQHSDDGSLELRLAKFIKPMGILTLSLLAITVLSGILRRKNPKLLLKWHKRCGITALITASIHAILVLIAH